MTRVGHARAHACVSDRGKVDTQENGPFAPDGPTLGTSEHVARGSEEGSMVPVS